MGKFDHNYEGDSGIVIVWDSEFCLWCGFGRSLTKIRKSNGLRTEPCGTPALGLIWLDKNPFTLT